MDTQYIISQICVIFAIISLGISYLSKDKTKILILSIIYALFYGTHNFLLGAITGVAMNIISIIRNAWFYINAKNQTKNKLYVLVSLCVLAIILGMISYTNITSLIPIIATILYTYSVWQDNTKIYRWMALPISALWITYNVCFKSVFGIILELILLAFEIVGIIKIKLGEKVNG